MPVYGMPKDSRPHGLSFETMVLGDLAYATSSFDAYVDTNRDYSTWYAKSSMGPIISNVRVSGGRVLKGIIRAQVSIRVKWKACVEASKARMTKLEALLTAREAHMPEETTWTLAREREIW